VCSNLLIFFAGLWLINWLIKKLKLVEGEKRALLAEREVPRSVIETRTDQVLKLVPRIGLKRRVRGISEYLRRSLRERMPSIPSVTISGQEKTVELCWVAQGRRQVFHLGEIRKLKISEDLSYAKTYDPNLPIRRTIECPFYKLSLITSDGNESKTTVIAQEYTKEAAESLAAEIARFLGLETVDKSP
jgi:hypothetical protein